MLVRLFRPWIKAKTEHNKYLNAKIDLAISSRKKDRIKISDALVMAFLQKARKHICSTTHAECKKAIDEFESLSNNSIYSKYKSDALHILEGIFDYDTFAKKSKKPWNAYELYKKCRYEICPYCNVGSIACNYTPKSKRGKSYRGDIDHFLPKSKYPYLALSLGNFIPACSDCNSIFKSTTDPLKTPILNPIEDPCSIKINFKLNASMSGIDEIEFTPNYNANAAKANNSIFIFQLNNRYNHKSAIRHANLRIATLASICNINYGQALMAQISGSGLPIARAITDPEGVHKMSDYKNVAYGRMYRDLYDKFIH